MKEIILVIRVATESNPFGKITRDDEVLICFHFIEAGSPPKTCENALEETNAIIVINKNFFKQGI
jgi:hypothetical protein